MKRKIIVEIDGVRHKLIKTKVENPCLKCSISDMCRSKDSLDFMLCTSYYTRYRKCKPGE